MASDKGVLRGLPLGSVAGVVWAEGEGQAAVEVHSVADVGGVPRVIPP